MLPWLLMTATNLGRNTVRGTRRYRSFLAGLPRCEDASDTADIALNDHGVGIDPVLRTGLRELRAVDAQLVVLVVLEGYAVTDAAGQVGLTVSAARSRLHRARTRLRDALGSDEREEHPANQRPENQGEPS